MWNLKKMVQMNLFTKQMELQMQKTTYGNQGGKDRVGEDKLRDWY